MMGQTCGVLLGEQATDGLTPFFTGLDKVRFTHPVYPGDVFRTECTITKARSPFYFAQGRGFVGETLCVKADYSFALIKR